MAFVWNGVIDIFFTNDDMRLLFLLQTLHILLLLLYMLSTRTLRLLRITAQCCHAMSKLLKLTNRIIWITNNNHKHHETWYDDNKKKDHLWEKVWKSFTSDGNNVFWENTHSDYNSALVRDIFDRINNFGKVHCKWVGCHCILITTGINNNTNRKPNEYCHTAGWKSLDQLLLPKN